METEFQPNEQSIKDMVTREVQKELSQLQTAKNKLPASPPATKALAETPDPHLEAEIKPNLVTAPVGKRHKRGKVAREREIHEHPENSSAVLLSLAAVLPPTGVVNCQKTPKAAPTAP